jgi:hypothetical protein
VWRRGFSTKRASASGWLELRTASHDTLRRRWVTTLSLLRAVGHVLWRVDSRASAVARAVIREAFTAMEDTQLLRQQMKAARPFHLVLLRQMKGPSRSTDGESPPPGAASGVEAFPPLTTRRRNSLESMLARESRTARLQPNRKLATKKSVLIACSAKSTADAYH